MNDAVSRAISFSLRAPRETSLFALGLLSLLSSSACGGGVPLLHPAHVLPPGRVSAGAGVSRNFVLGKPAEALDEARSLDADAASPKLGEALLAEAAYTPGIAPWVATRVGISSANEAGLTYSGRTFRVDGRHAFAIDKLALSVGLGARFRPFASDREGAIPFANTDDVKGFGADLPVLIGWRSDANVVQVWGGLRVGYERAAGTFELRAPNTSLMQADGEVEANHFFGEGLLGFTVGLEPIWVAAELAVGYGYAAGSVRFGSNAPSQDVDLSGLSLTPAGALVGRF